VVTDVEIRPAGVEEMAAVAELLSRSFATDPMLVWPLIAEEDGARDRIRQMFALLDTPLAARGWIWRTGDLAGAMSLIPAGEDAVLWELDRTARPLIASLTPDGGARYAAFWEWIASCYPDEPHWVIDQLAVDPARQGEGIGSALLRFALARASAERLPLFLETARERNVGYYRRFGFEVVLDEVAPDGGPRIWFMRRPVTAAP
jgi:ribosomal protein S18 acetylase RimI-like enzyme